MKEIVLLFLSSISFSLELEQDYIDEFTNDIIKRTSCEWLTWNGQMNSYFRFSNINGINYIPTAINLIK